MKTTSIEHDDMAAVYAGVAALLALFAYFGWQTAHAEIAYGALKWAWYQLGVVDIGVGPTAVTRWREEIADLAVVPGSVSPETLLRCLNNIGWAFVWIPGLLTMRGVRRAMKHPANRTRRPITASTLPKIMASHSPAVIPTLYYENLLNSDLAEHRSSLNPEDWVARHGLLVNGALDRTTCHSLLVADLGRPVGTLADLAPQEKALFAVFGSRLLADGHDHDEAQRLLDALNRSCHTGTWQGKRGYPDLTLTDAAFAATRPRPAPLHGWPGIPTRARSCTQCTRTRWHSVKLPSSHFRWLKGMDRALWYALNTTGRKAPVHRVGGRIHANPLGNVCRRSRLPPHRSLSRRRSGRRRGLPGQDRLVGLPRTQENKMKHKDMIRLFGHAMLVEYGATGQTGSISVLRLDREVRFAIEGDAIPRQLRERSIPGSGGTICQPGTCEECLPAPAVGDQALRLLAPCTQRRRA
ncbi:hypothetical protein LP420_38065 [Massilia sp. B-10]|nr:hypothetical protein LP420_38065 [Massilia sp. B-10]